MVMYDRIPDHLYHYSSTTNLLGILKEGIIPSKGPSPYYKQPYTPAVPETKVFMDTKLYKLKSPNTCVFEVIIRLLDPQKLHRYIGHYGGASSWYTYDGSIPANAIIVIAKRGADRHLYQTLVKREPESKWEVWSTMLFKETADQALDESIHMALSSNERRANFVYSVRVRRTPANTHEDLLDTKEVKIAEWLKTNPYTDRQMYIDYMKYNTSIPSSEYEQHLKNNGYD